MEVGNYRSGMAAEGKMMAYPVLEAAVTDTLLAAHRSIASLLILVGSLLSYNGILAKLPSVENRFPLDELHKVKKPDPENKDGSDTEDDDEDDEDADDQEDDDDAGDEDFSGEEGGEDDEDGDPDEDPTANGNEGSDDDDDEDGEDDEEGEEEEEEEEEEDEDDEDQPPAKKRK